ncbi:MAG: carbohydrate ABC transporter permease [Christensenellales bacterium]|jgi:putative aldouronate transport system permease protein
MTLTDKHGQSYITKVVIYTILAIFALSVLYPLYYLLMYSFSTYAGIASADKNPFMLYPAGFTTQAYEMFFGQSYIYTGFGVTIFRSVVGTTLSVVLQSLAAYAISKKGMPGRKLITWYFTLTMFFSGGLIPSYLIVKDMKLLDNIWVLVIPTLFSTYYIMVLRSYYLGIPESLEEAARLDGAGDLRIFFSIIIPVTLPAMATIGTWTFFGHWNAWFDSMLYITTTSKQVLQVHIRRLIIEQSTMLLSGQYVVGGKANQPTEASVNAAGIMITIIPVLVIYPFVRKVFTRGMTLGAVKE